MLNNNKDNYDNVYDEDKSAESTLSSQKDNSLTMPSTSSANIITEEVQLLVNFIERAATSYTEGNLENALHFYEQAIMIDPGNNVLFANKSAILLKLGRIKEAIEEASHSIQLKPEWPKAHFRKAEALKEAKEYEKAIISYCQAIQANSESQRFLNSLIICAQKSIIGEHFEAAYKQMKELGLEKSQFVTISVIGQQFLGVHDFQTAISVLKIALNIDSPSLKLKESTLGALAKAYYEGKNLSKAIDYLELQLELVTELKDIKTEIQVHENISEIAEIQKEYQLALVHRDSQIRLCHQLGLAVASINCSKASIYEKMNDYLSAEECYKLALKENTESYDANFGIGNILFKKNDISDAIIAFIKAKEVAPSQDYCQLAFIRICQCKIILGQTDEAINLLKTNLKTEKLLNPHILGNVLGIMCRAAEASDDVITFHRMAKRQLKLAIDTNNNFLKSEAFFSLSKFYERTNQKTNAKRLLELYLEITEKFELNHNPEQQILALLRLGKIEFESGNWEAAISITQKRLFLIKNCLKNTEMEANAHADLISIYRKMANMEKCKEHIKALENLRSTATENTLLQVASVYHIEMGEMFMENKEWEKAKDTFEKALIVVQELDKTEKEAELCKKLGIVHYKLERNEEAITYFNQFLMISQQQKNVISMLMAYGHLTQVHLKLENLEEGFDCAKFLLTLSNILNNSKEKITALLSIGRIFSKKEEHLVAIKILSKARRLAEKTDSKRELALCFGYLGECQLKINQRQKALTNFCKQLNYFPYINDVEEKCETIAHLIEEKILTNDVVWCAKLCRLQEDIAKEGSITLQMKVLRESAAKMHSLGCLDETTKSMEKALMLSIENEHPDTVTILLDLCEYYCETQQYHKAILALKEFAELQDGICGPDVFYQLSLMLLTQNRIDESIENLEKCETFDMVDNRFMYALSYAYYRKEDFKNAYFWLIQYIEANIDAKNIQQEKLLWERCLLDYRCGNISIALKELNLLVRTNVGPIIQYLDAFNLYTELEADLEAFLSLDCQIHFSISKKDYDKAKHYLQFYGDTKQCYMFENIAVNMLLNNPTNVSVDASFFNYTAEDYIPCFFKPSSPQMSKAIAAILAISNYSTVVESLRCIEVLLWKETVYEFTKAGKSFDIPEPTYEDVENAAVNLSKFLYSFSVDDITLIWIKNDNGKIEMFYNIEMAESLLPQFYRDVIKQVLFTSKIKQISTETINMFLRNCEICIGCSKMNKENYYFLLDYCTSTLRDFPEALALFVDSKNEEIMENVIALSVTAELSKQELLSRIATTSVVFLDLDDISEELLHSCDLFETVMSTNLCILCTKTQPKRAAEIAKTMVLNGCQLVVIVEDCNKSKGAFQNLLKGDLPKTISITLIKQMFSNINATFYTQSNSEKNIEVRGLSWMARRIICEEEYLDNYLKTEKDFTTYSYEFALHERLKQILSSQNDAITANDIVEIKHLSQEKYPYTKLKEYIYRYDDHENIAKLFLDLLPYQNRNTNKNLDSNELFQLMKSFEVRTKWRRRKKGKLSTRDCCSDGERFSVLSDKELTDSESVSGARVIGFDVENAEYKY